MKYSFILIILGINIQLSAQISDNFNNKDSSLSPIWQGDRANFEINSSGQLQLNATTAGVSELVSNYIVKDSSELNFWIKISFNTSTNNYVRIYLMADSSKIEASENALYWSFGESKDSIKLIARKGEILTSIYTCKNISTSHSVNSFRFSMILSSLNQLKFKIQKDEDSVFIINDSILYQLSLNTNTCFGLYCKYTISNASKIYFDDVYVGQKQIIQPLVIGERPEQGDLIINEVLFNPKDEGVDFVELYNNSAKKIDFKNVYISNKYNTTGVLKDVCKISSEQFILLPHTYVLLSSNCTIIKQQFSVPDSIISIDMIDFPAFNNDEGFVVISVDSSNIIDEMYYNETMHFQLLNDVEGVSLERISFTMPSDSATTWHSSSSINYATPGYQNSQYLELNQQNEEIQLSSSVFSPNNNGHDDVLSIQFILSKLNVICNVFVYNDKGELVRNIANNDLVATSGVYIWDGLGDNGTLLNAGPYIVYVDFYNTEGYKKVYKKVVVLAIDK